MQGATQESSESEGIVPRSVKMIFNSLEDERKAFDEEECKFEVKMSCYEIHVETVRDLLDPSNSQA